MWLQTTGSPKSRIDRCEFTNEKEVKDLEFKTFDVNRPKKKSKHAKPTSSK